MSWNTIFQSLTDGLGRLFSSRKLGQENKCSREPHFEEVVIFYNRVFDIGSFVNPTRVARDLLDHDFALAAPNYITGGIEVASRFDLLRKTQLVLDDLSNLQRLQETAGIWGILRWALQHPMRASKLASHLIKAHRSHRSGQKSNSALDEDENASKETVEEMAENTRQFVDDAMARVGLMTSLQTFTDKKLLNPQYLREVPLARIELQSFNATLAGENIGVDVGLLVHRTGVAILTFYVVYEGSKTGEELLRLINIASEPEIEEIRIARTIVEPHLLSYGVKSSQLYEPPFENEFSSGIEWLTYGNEKDKGTLTDVFEMYETAILAAIKGKQPSNPNKRWKWQRTPDWLIYPIVFARRIVPALDDAAAFSQQYPKTMAGLIYRTDVSSYRDKTIGEAIENDFSLSKDYSLYMEASHTTVFYYEPYWQKLKDRYGEHIPGQDWLYAYFQTSVIVDLLLIERWILKVIKAQLASLTFDSAKLGELKRNLLVALEEYHNIIVSYGSIHHMIGQVREKLGTHQIQRGIMEKLNLLDRLIEVEESRQRSWRDRFLKASTALVTIILGLPATSRFTQSLQTWDTVNPASYEGLGVVINKVATFAEVYPTEISVALYLMSLCIVLPMIALSILPLRKEKQVSDADQSYPAHIEGFTWHDRIVWQRETRNFDNMEYEQEQSLQPDAKSKAREQREEQE